MFNKNCHQWVPPRTKMTCAPNAKRNRLTEKISHTSSKKRALENSANGIRDRY